MNISTGLTALPSSQPPFAPEAGAAEHGVPGDPLPTIQGGPPWPRKHQGLWRGPGDLKNIVPHSLMRCLCTWHWSFWDRMAQIQKQSH